MTNIKKTRIVNYSCEQMFALVNDVEHYAEFLPYCTQSFVNFRNENEVQATLVISAAGINKSFTTNNRLQTNKMIEIRLVDGPFKSLEGFWLFEEINHNSCQIIFDLEFEFINGLFVKFISPIFAQITNQMVDEFCLRAEQLYGKY